MNTYPAILCFYILSNKLKIEEIVTKSPIASTHITDSIINTYIVVAEF